MSDNSNSKNIAPRGYEVTQSIGTRRYVINSAVAAMQQHAHSVSPVGVTQQPMVETQASAAVQNPSHVTAVAGAAIKANQARDIIFNLSENESQTNDAAYVEELLRAVKADQATAPVDIAGPEQSNQETTRPADNSLDIDAQRENIAQLFRDEANSNS